MPPHLHPRSTATSTLFAGTLLASFTVVAIPHIFPCPRPRRAYADAERQLDSDGRPVRRKRRKSDEQHAPEAPDTKDMLHRDLTPSAVAGVVTAKRPECSARSKPEDPKIEDEAALFRQFQDEAKMLEKEAHECPVPKPGGVLGRLLGFQQDENKQGDLRERSRDPEVA
jgi:cytochrome c oxidase assembly factor 2